MMIKMTKECPMEITRKKSYYCSILQVNRRGEEEEICSLCPALNKQMKQNKMLREAFDFAEKAHQGQYRKGTDIPYLIHLIRAWGYVSKMTESETEQAAALLHDVLEDTDVTKEELERLFGGELAELVAKESEHKRAESPAHETWVIRKQETIERLKKCMESKDEQAAMRIAFGDKLANLYSMMFEYRYVGDRLWNKFNQKDKKHHEWYYGEMGKIFKTYFAEDEPELVEEYREYFKEVFEGNEI
ncbi:MAG: HD domain-containing protein [Lachnospiraceae bacterium]|nr:HD domain-containing protein [Lachnospiraceae bacterium]